MEKGSPLVNTADLVSDTLLHQEANSDPLQTQVLSAQNPVFSSPIVVFSHEGEASDQTKLLMDTTESLTLDSNHSLSNFDAPGSLQESISPLIVPVTSENIKITSNSLSEKRYDPTLEETLTIISPMIVETVSVLLVIETASKLAPVPLSDEVSVPLSEKVIVLTEKELAWGRPISPKRDAILLSNRSPFPPSAETITPGEMFPINSEVTSKSFVETTINESAIPLKTDSTCLDSTVESNEKVLQALGSEETPLDLSFKVNSVTSLEIVPLLSMDTVPDQSVVANISSIQSNLKPSTEDVLNLSMETDFTPLVGAVPTALMKLDAESLAEAVRSSLTESNSAASVEVSPLLNTLANSDVSPMQSSIPVQDGQTSNKSLPNLSVTANANTNLLNGHDITCPGTKSSENNETVSKFSVVANGSVDQDILVMDVVGANEYRETPIVIEDSEEESWTSDSEEDSSSDEEDTAKKSVESSSSDSSSDEEEEKEDLEQKLARLKQKELNFKKNQSKRDSKNCRLPKELLLTDLPCIEDLQISVPEEEAQAIGEVTGIVEELVIVEAYDNLRPIDLDSVLFLKQGSEALGIVFDVFGCVKKPSYAVRFNNKDHILQRGITVGDQVFFAPRTDHCKFVDVEDLMRYRGSDASWEHDKEPPPTCVDFSDDEDERSGRRTKKNLSRNLDKTGPSSRESVQKRPRTDNYFSRSSDQQHRNRQPHQQPNNNWNNRNVSQQTNIKNCQSSSHSSGFTQAFAGRQDHSYKFPPSEHQNNFGNAGNGHQQPPSASRFYSAPPTCTPTYFPVPPPCPSPLAGIPPPAMSPMFMPPPAMSPMSMPPPAMSPMSMPPPAPSPHTVGQSPSPWDTTPFLPSTTAPIPHTMIPPNPPPPTARHPTMNQGPAFFPSSYGNTHNDPNSGPNVQFSRPPPSSHFMTPQEQKSASFLWRSVSNPNLNHWSQPPPSQQNDNQSLQPRTSSPVKFGSAANLNSLDLSRPPPCNPASFGSAPQFPRIFPNSGESNACSARDSYQNAASAANAPPSAIFFNQPPPPGVNFQQNHSMIPNPFTSIPPPPPSERNHDSSHGATSQFSQMNFGNQGY